MGYRVLIPTPLRPYTDSKDAVDMDGGTVGDVLAALTARYPALRRHLYADDGTLRHFVNVYVNDDDIRYLERDATVLKSGDVISIIPSVAGGAPVAAGSAATRPGSIPWSRPTWSSSSIPVPPDRSSGRRSGWPSGLCAAACAGT